MSDLIVLLTHLSKVFFDKEKPQTFTDKLKIFSKYFILKLGQRGFSFSRKTDKNFNKAILITTLREKIKNHEGSFVPWCGGSYVRGVRRGGAGAAHRRRGGRGGETFRT